MAASTKETHLAAPVDDDADGLSEAGSTSGRRGKGSEEKDGGADEQSGATKGADKAGNALSALGALGTGGRRGKPKIVVDREKTCPFLVRIFCKTGSHHEVSDFGVDKLPTADEIQIHTWKDATLRELASLLSQTQPSLLLPTARISFRAAYQDITRGGIYNLKDLGSITNFRRTPDEEKTLDEARFVIGDYIDVAIYVSEERRESRDTGGPVTSSFGPIRGGDRGGNRHHPYGRPNSARAGGAGGPPGGGFGIRGRSGSSDFGRRGAWGSDRDGSGRNGGGGGGGGAARGEGVGGGFRSDFF
ncbi:Histone deacetylase complex subunit sap18 [Phlyctochytrium planicorne]|nr:Histone deacetylase complex subunit sap18 [Phlyctochytrium planicorne]